MNGWIVNDNGVDRPMTDREIAEWETNNAAIEAEQAAISEQLAERDSARQSARIKLAALGLTEAEIAALVGG